MQVITVCTLKEDSLSTQLSTLYICIKMSRSFHICRRSGSSGGRRSGSGMSMGGTATSGSNTSVSGSLVGGGRLGSQERGAWAGMDPALHLAHSHGLHLPQGPLQPHLPHQEDSKRKSRSDHPFNHHLHILMYKLIYIYFFSEINYSYKTFLFMTIMNDELLQRRRESWVRQVRRSQLESQLRSQPRPL